MLPGKPSMYKLIFQPPQPLQQQQPLQPPQLQPKLLQSVQPPLMMTTTTPMRLTRVKIPPTPMMTARYLQPLMARYKRMMMMSYPATQQPLLLLFA